MASENFRPLRTWKSLITEEILLSLLAYGVLVIYATGWLSFGVMQLLVMVYVIRIFTLRHERTHVGIQKSRAARLLNLIDLHHLPYQEPFDASIRKHLDHHRAHLAGRNISLAENPHGYLDRSFGLSLLNAFFYDELMLFLDIRREGGLSPERGLQIVVSSTVLIFLAVVLGIKPLLLFCLAYRIALTTAWFSFSYLLHIPFLYKDQPGPYLPRLLKQGLELIFGSGFITSVFYHRSHHSRPLSYYKFDRVR